MMCCYYPTTTLAIDDDADFLTTLTKHLGIPDCRPVPSAKNALEALNGPNSFERIQDRVLKTSPMPDSPSSLPEDYTIQVNPRGLHEEIYNANRFRDVSVLIVDYYMGSETGVEICQALQNHPAKKILLTGGRDMEQIALEAFNKGIIHRFISKFDPNFPTRLKQAVIDLKEAYFKDLTSSLLPGLLNGNLNLIQHPAYVNFVKNLQGQLNAVEYYTIDSTGSRIFLDENGETTWFIVKHESELNDFVALAQDQEASSGLIQALEDRKLIPFFFSDEDYRNAPSEWEPFLYKAQPLPGLANYYYSISKENSEQLNKKTVASYASYSS